MSGDAKRPRRFRDKGEGKSRAIDLSGIRFGCVVAVSMEQDGDRKNGAMWKCVCDCGKTATIGSSALLSKKVRRYCCKRGCGMDTVRRLDRIEVLEAEQRGLLDELGFARPVVRSDCESVPRPCPFVSCRHHLALKLTDLGTIVSRRGLGRVALSGNNSSEARVEEFTTAVVDDLAEMEHTCELDRGDLRGEKSVKEALGVCREHASVLGIAAEQSFRSKWLELYGDEP